MYPYIRRETSRHQLLVGGETDASQKKCDTIRDEIRESKMPRACLVLRMPRCSPSYSAHFGLPTLHTPSFQCVPNVIKTCGILDINIVMLAQDPHLDLPHLPFRKNHMPMSRAMLRLKHVTKMYTRNSSSAGCSIARTLRRRTK